MTIRFRCQKCGKKLKAQDHEAGIRFKCSACGTPQVVPTDPLRAPLTAEELPPPPEDILKIAKTNRDDNELDMTPMVDVVFQLLIFFTITASFDLQKSMEIPTPDPADATAQSRTIEQIERDSDYVVVTIDKDNLVWFEDHQITTRLGLLAQLRDARESRKARYLMVNAHGDALHEQVVMVLDVGNAVGMERMSLTTTDE